MQIDHKKDANGEWDEVWLCDAPAMGVKYQVIKEQWSKDWTTRWIKEIKIAPVELATAPGVVSGGGRELAPAANRRNANRGARP